MSPASAVVAEVSVNGIAVDPAGFPSPAAAAVRELLRQRAVATGVMADGANAGEVDAAIERLLEREVVTPEPGEAECRRYYQANPQHFMNGERAGVRHILFQLTPGTPVNSLRARAEQALRELLHKPERFGALARECSNCTSAQHDGRLGEMRRGEAVPEFEAALFPGTWTGIARQLVKTRFGFHIVAVDHRVAGEQLPFADAHAAIAQRLRSGVQRRALEQYVRVLAGQAEVHGADLAAVATPLVQ